MDKDNKIKFYWLVDGNLQTMDYDCKNPNDPNDICYNTINIIGSLYLHNTKNSTEDIDDDVSKIATTIDL